MYIQSEDVWFAESNIMTTAQQPVADQPVQAVPSLPVGFTREFAALADVCGNLSSGFLLLNEQERIIYCNQSALRLLRLTKSTASSTEKLDLRKQLLALAADPLRARSDLERLWRATEQEYTIELALTSGEDQGSTTRWLRLRTFPVRSHDSHLSGRGFLLEDITLERSAAEAHSEALARAAHELKTPLAVIKGCATTLLGNSARWDAAIQREMLQMIDTQADRLHDVLNTLLDVWRFETGACTLHLAQVQLADLLLQQVKYWQNDIQAHRFVLDIPPDIAPVMCDAGRIELVMNHLIGNAIAYSPAGSPVKIRLEANDVEVRVSITDEGVGIAPQHLEHIFDRFYRISSDDEPQKGSGLGLAAARATVEAHGGKIWADSAGPGHGATFYFTLPFTPRTTSVMQSCVTAALAESDATLPQQRSTTPLALRRTNRSAHVLLAESDSRLIRYLRANLEEQQYRVHAVSQGLQCLRQLDLEEPEILILSTRLADMSGIELLQRVREFSQTPVIMLCDDCDEDERAQLLDLGSDDLVIKPFSMKELLARVRALLRRRTAAPEQAASQSVFTTGELTIDYAQHIVTVQGRQIQLSRTEYKLLSLLAQNAGIVVTHELLLEKVWGPEYNRDIDFIWVYISRLRRKIETDSRRPRYILTVPDVGYKLAKL